MRLTVSNVHVDSSLLSDDVSDFCSPPYANYSVALISSERFYNNSRSDSFSRIAYTACRKPDIFLVPLGAATVSRN